MREEFVWVRARQEGGAGHPALLYRPRTAGNAPSWRSPNAHLNRRSPRGQLPQPFVKDDADGGGQVEAAHLAGRHGDDEGALGVPCEDLRRQSAGLAAEEKAVAVRETDVSV